MSSLSHKLIIFSYSLTFCHMNSTYNKSCGLLGGLRIFLLLIQVTTFPSSTLFLMSYGKKQMLLPFQSSKFKRQLNLIDVVYNTCFTDEANVFFLKRVYSILKLGLNHMTQQSFTWSTISVLLEIQLI